MSHSLLGRLLKSAKTGLIMKKRYCDISNTLNAVVASKFQDTFFFLVEFDTLELEIFLISWIGSVGPVDGV